ncbi:hypothetical protein LMG29739_02016 [Paraburkholderia solisilvae]|uniref:Uncharacterized protein n=1 Tax=Paraburkholderia solisilvae TaxID=624376 RepID=A0A6J5DKC8_9BURK|nr:hypothetical protein LMG29739_02016 [Paraburkholderia solisilvae]
MWIGGFCGANSHLTYAGGEAGIYAEACWFKARTASTRGLMAVTLRCTLLMYVDEATSRPVCAVNDRNGFTNGGGRTIHDAPTNGGHPNSGHRASR